MKLSQAGLFTLPFAIVMGLLVLASVGQDLLIYLSHGGQVSRDQWVKSTKWLLETNSELSFYSWASAAIIFLNAALLYMIALASRRRVWGWLILSAIFVLLSADEAMSFHERLVSMIQARWALGGVFHFAWVIPGMIFCALVGLSYIPFLLALPRRTALLMLLSGIVFVAGAIGMEMIGGSFAAETGTFTMTYQMLTNAEEALEGLGMVLFLYTLMEHAVALGVVSLRREPAAGG
ncbi:hypothetical protein [Geminicoccus harenae]|uniref:hypothetical protein n=1 Tax=Geminicoccus harenae TaxID=2498453 RepID=UPI00168A7788|nr:hypothetical protein [Geminicoccus harenae]